MVSRLVCTGGTAQEYTDEIVKRSTAAAVNDKVVALSADNENVNFGGEKRGGTKNVFFLLKERLERPLMGVNCHCHVCHNSVQKSADASIPYDLPILIGKLYQEFEYETSHVTALSKLCEEEDIEHLNVLSATKSRWLSLLPALGRLETLFQPLRTYFLSLSKPPKILKTFFEDPCALFWIKFARHLCERFHITIKVLEGDHICALEALGHVENLLTQLRARREEVFIPRDLREHLDSLIVMGDCTESEFNDVYESFYCTAVEYVESNMKFLAALRPLSWVLLREEVTWVKVRDCLPVVLPLVPVDDDKLFDEVVLLREYLTTETPTGSPEEKWNKVVEHFNSKHLSIPETLKIAQFVFCMPGSNAFIERVFSIIKGFWTDGRFRLDVATVEAITVLKTYFSMSCVDFHKYLVQHKPLLEAIHGNEKY
eukprot:GHVU01080038.1.p1 GENE.GHVU01080038.1~~GHVU01080038.1.p1  ORF type:complete len:428 (+),score=58.22 GHVU01080038.1:953-2236(+)